MNNAGRAANITISHSEIVTRAPRDMMHSFGGLLVLFFSKAGK